MRRPSMKWPFPSSWQVVLARIALPLLLTSSSFRYQLMLLPPWTLALNTELVFARVGVYRFFDPFLHRTSQTLLGLPGYAENDFT